MYFKQSVVEYSLKHGVTVAAIRYKQHRKTIYRWREKYNGTVKLLANKSHKPHLHPSQHTPEELSKIKRFKAQNKDDGIGVLWIKLIKPRTPRHNGKVERSHRKDQEEFYFKRVFVSFGDFKEKLKRWMIAYNNFLSRCDICLTNLYP